MRLAPFKFFSYLYNVSSLQTVLIKEIPFLRIVIPFCAGIISGRYANPDQLFLIVTFVTISILLVPASLIRKRFTNSVFGIAISLLFYFAGHLLYKGEKNALSSLEASPAIYTASVSEFPEEKPGSLKTILRFYSVESKGEELPVEGSVLVYFKKDPLIESLLPGDFIRISLTPVPIVNRGNPCEFDYRFYMENHSVKYSCFSSAGDIRSHSAPRRRKPVHQALIIRERIIDMYRERGIVGDRLALVAAMTLGQKNLLDPEQEQIFIKAGVMHIMAVSGLHAVILSWFISCMFFFMKGRLEILRVIITLALLWSFAFVTGLTPSVLRATLMFTFINAGGLMKRNVNSLNSVLASAFVLMLYRPSVLFDAGFLLSYSAVIFIICFYRDLYKTILFRRKLPDKIWQSASVTIVAQAGTLPLTISLFNRFPVWFLITNIIIVPLSSIIVIIGCLVPLTYPLPFISFPLSSLLGFLTGLTETLTMQAANLPLATIDNIGMPSLESFLLFILVFSASLFFFNRRQVPVAVPLCAFLLYISAGTSRQIANSMSDELIVYNTYNTNAVGIRNGKRLHLFCDTSLIPEEVMRHCSTKGLKPEVSINGENARAIGWGGGKILITETLTGNGLRSENPDIVVLQSPYPSVQKDITVPDSSLILVTGQEVSYRYRIPPGLSETCRIYSVRDSGAFRMRLR